MLGNIQSIASKQLSYGQAEPVKKNIEYTNYSVSGHEEIKCAEEHVYYHLSSPKNDVHIIIRDTTNALTNKKEKWVYVKTKRADWYSCGTDYNYAMKYDGEKLKFSAAYTDNPAYGADLSHDGLSSSGKNIMLSTVEPLITSEKQNLKTEQNKEKADKIKEHLKILEHVYDGTKLMPSVK